MYCIGYDAKGIKRVWGEGVMSGKARREAKEAANNYVKRRPDTGPLSRWRFDLASDTVGGFDRAHVESVLATD